MSKRRLKTLGLSARTLDSLQKANMHTIQSVLECSDLNLMTQLDSSIDSVSELTTSLSGHICPKIQTALQMVNEDRMKLSFGNAHLDHLFYGGLSAGTITELMGPAGVGKTQLCLHLCIEALKPGSAMHGASVLYIDTESAFRIERIGGMLEARGIPQESCVEITKHIFVQQPDTAAGLSNILDSLEVFAVEKNVRVLMIDSMASLARKDFSCKLILQRSLQIAHWAAQIKKIASKLKLTVVVTNQVMTKYHDDPQTAQGVCAALGVTWEHCINTRVTMQYMDEICRKIVVTKSHMAPPVEVAYTIHKQGIVFSDQMNILQGIDPHSMTVECRPSHALCSAVQNGPWPQEERLSLGSNNTCE